MVWVGGCGGQGGSLVTYTCVMRKMDTHMTQTHRQTYREYLLQKPNAVWRNTASISIVHIVHLKREREKTN